MFILRSTILGLLLPMVTVNCLCQEIPSSIRNKAELLLEEENERDLEAANTNQLLDELAVQFSHPIALNQIRANEILSLPFLNRNQAIELMKYRETYGKILSLNELLLIPGFDSTTVNQIAQIITLDEISQSTPLMKRLFSNIKNQAELRWSQNLSPPIGYHPASDSTNHRYAGYYPGIAAGRRFKYTLSSPGGLAIGLIAENDAGEPFRFEKGQLGFDFISGYIQVTGRKLIKRILLGDYSLSLGQGLAAWTGFSFRKGGYDERVWKRGKAIKPYTSGDGNLFLRGGAIELNHKRVNLTLYSSIRAIDGRIYTDDTLNYPVISEGTTGLHRTKSERERRGIVNQFIYGADLSYLVNSSAIGFTFITTEFSAPPTPTIELYRIYSKTKQFNKNYSLHYLFIGKRITLFGEVALSEPNGLAFIIGNTTETPFNGILNMVYRNYNLHYSAPLSNGFGENSHNNNERGFFLSWGFKPSPSLNLSLSSDIYKTSWIAYRTDFPSNGKEYTIKATWQPLKEIGISLRFRGEDKTMNSSSSSTEILAEPTSSRRTTISSRIDFKHSKNLKFCTRLEWKESETGGKSKEGTALGQSITYTYNKLSITLSTMLFTSLSYEVRSSLSEPEIQGNFTIPGLIGEGYRNSILIKWKYHSINLNLKYSHAQLHHSQCNTDSPDSYITPTRDGFTLQIIYKSGRKTGKVNAQTDAPARYLFEPSDPQ